jgi:hypothetical protein
MWWRRTSAMIFSPVASSGSTSGRRGGPARKPIWFRAYLMGMGLMRWDVRATAYVYLLRDEYPPFGSGPYPVTFDVDYPEQSNRWSVALRLILAIPQLIVLVFVLLAWLVTVVIAWFAILFTGRYPEGLFRFGVGVQRWTLRVQAYLFLMRDEYPPFSLE